MALDTIVSRVKLDGIAGAIRAKGGTSEPLTLDQMIHAIMEIPSGGGGGGTSPFLEQVLKDPSDTSSDPHDIDLDLAAWGNSSPYSGSAKIRDYAFYNSTGNMSVPVRRLGSVTIPAWINQVGYYAFYSAGMTSLEFAADASMLTINAYAFAEQPSLTSIKGTRQLYLSGNCPFRNCANLETIDIKLNAWSSTPNYAFAGCTSLHRAILRCDNHMSGIDAAAFSGCTSLAELVIDENNPSPYMLVSLASDALNNVPETCSIYVPDAQVDAYKTATNWSTRADHIFPLSTFVEE